MLMVVGGHCKGVVGDQCKAHGARRPLQGSGRVLGCESELV